MTTPEVRRRDKAMARIKTLQETRQKGWDPHWRSVANNLLPRHSRFLAEQQDRGERVNTGIIDSEGTRALRILAAGMMAGMTSPARPWFRLGLPDDDMAEQHAVKVWLDDATKLLLKIFRKSNTYNTLHDMYRELGAFGTGCSVVRPNFERVIHHNPMTVGSYALGVNDEGYVDKLQREFKLKVEQAIQWFGKENLPPSAISAYDNSRYDHELTVHQIIEPNPERDRNKPGPKHMAFRSEYWNKAQDGPQAGLLSEGGFKQFPAICPRWDIIWGDTYGFSPGMETLGDLLQLQFDQSRKAKGIDYQTDPPLQVPTNLRGQNADFLPGGVSYYDSSNPNGGIRTAFEVQLDLQWLLEDIRDVRQRIDSAFYADMFLMLTNVDKSGMTATEVAERHEEKLLMIGPVLERLHNELLEPLVSFTFQQCLQAGILPPIPEELNGVELQIEFVSTLAQAQKAVSVNSSDRLLGHIGMLVELKGGDPAPMDKFNVDKSIERYADQLGVDPDLIVADDKVMLIRQDRAQQAAAAAQAQQAEQLAGAAAKAGTVETGPGAHNAAADILSMFSGYQSPSAIEL